MSNIYFGLWKYILMFPIYFFTLTHFLTFISLFILVSCIIINMSFYSIKLQCLPWWAESSSNWFSISLNTFFKKLICIFSCFVSFTHVFIFANSLLWFLLQGFLFLPAFEQSHCISTCSFFQGVDLPLPLSSV